MDMAINLFLRMQTVDKAQISCLYCKHKRNNFNDGQLRISLCKFACH